MGKIGLASDVFDAFKEPSRYKALYGGRGSAKSHFFAEAMVGNAASLKGFRAVCVREVQRSLRESAKRLIEDKIADLGVETMFTILNDRIVTPGGGAILFQGMQDHTADSIKSLEGCRVAWVEEAQTLSSRSLELLRPTIRSPGSELWFSWNPRNASDPVDEFFRGESPPENAVIARINYDQNRFFPAELEEERIHDREHNPQRYAHIWLGEYEPQAIGAIWDRQTIHENRWKLPADELPTMERIVVGVDPAVSSETGSNEHGIVVCGAGDDGRGYVLDDVSTVGSPKKWATRTIAAFDKHEADAVVIEINQGGYMVKHTLQSIREDLPIIEVRATRGKHVRAEPISALYSLGRVSHVGSFPELEAQMCQMTAAGYEGEGSPDHVDAMVWAFTELFPSMTERPAEQTERYRPPRSVSGWMGA
ncbi:MAG: PBSX family phage terminase large subunit [Alphaproteobacteria bacterium]|nr:PBSX family phage terminase large subunit [Alphaproteobacteria bacterium]